MVLCFAFLWGGTTAVLHRADYCFATISFSGSPDPKKAIRMNPSIPPASCPVHNDWSKKRRVSNDLENPSHRHYLPS
ncbi:hypothetical protein BJX99DRAFT_217343 [Aspergillus californicus]